MKAEITNKLSSYVFYGLLVITAIVLVMFYAVGYDNVETVTGGKVANSPLYTDLLMYWMYALMVIGTICVAVFGVMQFFTELANDPKGAIKSIVSIAILIALFVVAYFMASDEPILSNGKVFEEKTPLIISDVCIYVQYVLLAVSLVSAILSLAGVFKMFNRVKA